MSKPALIWLRQDLRLEDNPAIQAAIENGELIVPIYIWAPEEEGNWAPGAASRWWLHYSLKSLESELKKFHIHLIIRKGDSLQILHEIASEIGATSIYWNRRYEPAIIKRDTHIKSELHALDYNVQSFNANLLFEPWTIANKKNEPFRVFTPFWKKCQQLPQPSIPETNLKSLHGYSKKIASLTIDELEFLPRIHWDTGIKANWKPGASAAKEIAKHFIQDPITHYPAKRNRPDVEGVSQLSPYLHFGEISPSRVWQLIKEKYQNNNHGAESFLRQLVWREFAYHLLYHYPHTPERPLRTDFGGFPWLKNDIHLKAWQKGLTGYPLVDAGMRQLWKTGWMHNRVRMVVGSFLVKDLLLPWQEGAKWFWDTLVDADLANNTLGWQWIGGCGADAAPYFRIFNPITQSEKFDPEGNYIRKWVPELSKLSNDCIHQPWKAEPLELRQAGIVMGKTYPMPIVDHAEARKAALEAFAKR